jgi:hypothetical protein
MKIGFLTDKNGYRAPLHPESIEKYLTDLYIEKDIFKFLNYQTEDEKIKSMSSVNDLDIVACVENLDEDSLKKLKQGAIVIGIFDYKKIDEIKNLRPDVKVLSFLNFLEFLARKI